MKNYFLVIATAAALVGCSKEQAVEPIEPATEVSQSADGTITQQYGIVKSKPYFFMNNRWNGNASNYGTQSSYFHNLGNWGAEAKYNAGNNKDVLSYPALVYGSHYDNDSGAGRLPKKISDLGKVHTAWNQQSNSRRFDASYDLWFDSKAYPDKTKPCQNELMIWVDWKDTNPITDNGYNASGAIPTAKVKLGTRTWNVYFAKRGRGNVISFLPVSGPNNSITVDAKPLIDYCVKRGWLQKTQYLTSIQAGWEIIGKGTFRTKAFTIDGSTI